MAESKEQRAWGKIGKQGGEEVEKLKAKLKAQWGACGRRFGGWRWISLKHGA